MPARPRPAARLHADRSQLGPGGRGARGTLPLLRAGPPGPRRRVRAAAGDLRRRRPRTCAALKPSASRCAATRWAGGWRSHAALRAAGARVERLVLIGASPGIADAAERAARRDGRRRRSRTASRRMGLEAFVDEWGAQPLFAGQPRGVAEAARRDRLRNTAAGLAAALRGMGTGVMEPLWDRLGRAGDAGDAGRRRARREVPRDRGADGGGDPGATSCVVVQGAGHAVHLERPRLVADGRCAEACRGSSATAPREPLPADLKSPGAAAPRSRRPCVATAASTSYDASHTNVSASRVRRARPRATLREADGAHSSGRLVRRRADAGAGSLNPAGPHHRQLVRVAEQRVHGRGRRGRARARGPLIATVGRAAASRAAAPTSSRGSLGDDVRADRAGSVDAGLAPAADRDARRGARPCRARPAARARRRAARAWSTDSATRSGCSSSTSSSRSRAGVSAPSASTSQPSASRKSASIRAPSACRSPVGQATTASRPPTGAAPHPRGEHRHHALADAR